MKALLSIPIAAALTCGTLTAGVAEPLKQQLVGTWSVISFVNENERTGKTTKVFWFRSKGYFMFEPANHFSINLMRPGRPKFGRRDFPLPGESRAALEGIIVMFGDYKINRSEHSISLQIIGGSFPAWDNTIRSVSSRSTAMSSRIKSYTGNRWGYCCRHSETRDKRKRVIFWSIRRHGHIVSAQRRSAR